MITKLYLIVLLAASCALLAGPHEGQELVGKPAPRLELEHWINSPPLEITDLRGKVVLLRWWTDTCALCAATAPALRKLQTEFGPKGLQVVGIFHPKPAGDWNLDRVQRAVARFDFTFPVALDADWKALRRWWLDAAPREYTSVSFIVDKHGVIRFVHPGGEYNEGKCLPGHEHCEEDFKSIEKTISELLAEN